MAAGSRKVYCTAQCNWLHRRAEAPKNPDWLAGRQVERPVKCLACSAPGAARSWNWYCQPCAADRDRSKNRRKNTARRQVVAGLISVRAIGERDGWRCHLCSRRVDPSLSGMDPMGPTIDHLIPISAGGEDTPRNVALAHRSCNTRRGARGIAQLRLVA